MRSQADIRACAADSLQRGDARLNQLYRRMLARLQGHEDAQQALRRAQHSWAEFREQECRFAVWPLGQGSMGPVAALQCQGRITRLQEHLACASRADEQTRLQCPVLAAD